MATVEQLQKELAEAKKRAVNLARHTIRTVKAWHTYHGDPTAESLHVTTTCENQAVRMSEKLIAEFTNGD